MKREQELVQAERNKKRAGGESKAEEDMSKVITRKERRYQEEQLQMGGEMGRKDIMRSSIEENIRGDIQTYKKSWEQMTCLQKCSWCSLDHLDLLWLSLTGRVPLSPKRKKLQVRPKNLFGESSLSRRWLQSLRVKCPLGPPE